MTLSIITSHKNGLILAADRRTLNRTIHPELKFTHHIGVFYDGFQKVNVLKSPHSFVAFTLFGNGAVEIDLILEDFGKTLPQKRLTILEYAHKLNDFLIEVIAENEYPTHIDVSAHNSHIAVAGYDENQNFCKIYEICPEKNLLPEDLINGMKKTVCGGDTRYLQLGTNFFFKNLSEALMQKNLKLSKLGFKLSRDEIQLINALWQGSNVQNLITFPMAIDLAKTAIRETAHEQVRRDEFPMVGDTMDILTITPKEGATFVIHDKEKEGYLQVADTNKHHIFVKCCKTEIYFQIHFGEEKPLSKGFVRYPSNSTYVCPECKNKHDINPLFDLLLEAFSDAEIDD